MCSYHLQEAGATPVQEIAYALSTAIAVLDAVRDSGQVPAEQLGEVVGRISFFVNAGVRFVEEMCKMRAFARLWDTITRERYGIADPARRRFRYGVQVNSLGLTEAQPENNVQRIVLEMLAVTLSKDARARAVQLPGLERGAGPAPALGPAVVACASSRCSPTSRDLLEYDDIFDGSHVVEAKVAELVERRRGGDRPDRRRWAGRWRPSSPATSSRELVSSHAARRARIESGEDEDRRGQLLRGDRAEARSPPTSTPRSMTVDPANEARVVAALRGLAAGPRRGRAPPRRWPG